MPVYDDENKVNPNLAELEQNAARPDTSSTKDPSDAASLKDGEEQTADQVGDKGYTGSGSGSGSSKKKTKGFWNKRRARVAGLATALALMTGGSAMVVPTVMQPWAAINYMNILNKPSLLKQNDDGIRLGRLVYNARRATVNGDNFIASNRLSSAEYTINKYGVNDLKKIGLGFEFDEFGRISTISIDTKSHPDYKGLSEQEARVKLADQLNIKESGVRLEGTKISADISPGKVGIGKLRSFFGEQFTHTSSGRAVSFIQYRTLAKYLNLPSMFKPWSRAKIAAQEKIFGFVKDTKTYEKYKELEKQRATKVAARTPKAQALIDGVKSKVNGVQAKVGGALLLTAGVCLAYDISGEIPELNRAAVVLPAVASAADGQAAGSQVESSDDFDGPILNAFLANQTAPDGTTPYDSADINYLQGRGGGVEADPAIKAAFASSSTAAGFRDTLNSYFKADTICSTGGQIAQGAVGVGLLLTGSGTVVAKVIGTVAGAVVGAAAINGIMALVEHYLVADPVEFIAHQGALGGSLDALGAREAANIAYRASGGVALSEADARLQTDAIDQLEQKQFEQQGLYAKLTDVNNTRSLASRLAIATKGQSTTMLLKRTPNIIGSTLATVPSLFKKVSLSPSVSAADKAGPLSQPGFPLYGTPSSEMDDPSLQDPFQTANKAAAILDSSAGPDLIARAQQCFGSTISKDTGEWDAVRTTDVNPASGEYLGANCGDTSMNFKLIKNFLANLGVADAFLCYHGEEDACARFSAGGGTQTTSTAPGATVDSAHLFEDSTQIPCASGTKDLGIQDGYHNGARVPIRICAVTNIKSTGAESNGLYGVPDANGLIVVNSRVSGAFYAMGAAAAKPTNQSGLGKELSATSSFRTMANQQNLYNKYGSVRAAKPGYSNHQMGLAVDLEISAPVGGSDLCTQRVRAPQDAMWVWMNKFATKYGFYQYAREAWHWDAENDNGLTHCASDGAAA